MPLSDYGVQQVLLSSVTVGLLRASSGADPGAGYVEWLRRGMAECSSALGYGTIGDGDMKSLAVSATSQAASGVRYGTVGSDWAATTFATSIQEMVSNQGGSRNLFDEIRNNVFPTLRQSDVDSAEAYGYAWGMDNPN